MVEIIPRIGDEVPGFLCIPHVAFMRDRLVFDHQIPISRLLPIRRPGVKILMKKTVLFGLLVAVSLATLACSGANGSTISSAEPPSTVQSDSTRLADSSTRAETGTTASQTVSTTASDLGTKATGEAAGSNGGGYAATDTSYTSATTSISIATVSTGSGEDAVTYYVADVQLQPGTLLGAGLADGFTQGGVEKTSAIANASNAVLAINGDYCTGRNTGIIIRNGVLYLDNPIRVGLAIYKDGTMRVYDETEISAEQLLADGVWNTYSFGPALLAEGLVSEDLDESKVEDIGEEHTILGSQPRTGVGIIEANHFVFVVVDGRSPGYSIGMTLSEFAQIFKQLGCTAAYNLDGGGSSAMYFMGELVNNPLGRGQEREISDVLFVAG